MNLQHRTYPETIQYIDTWVRGRLDDLKQRLKRNMVSTAEDLSRKNGHGNVNGTVLMELAKDAARIDGYEEAMNFILAPLLAMIKDETT